MADKKKYDDMTVQEMVNSIDVDAISKSPGTGMEHIDFNTPEMKKAKKEYEAMTEEEKLEVGKSDFSYGDEDNENDDPLE